MEEIIKAYMMERALVLVPALWIVGGRQNALCRRLAYSYILLARHRGRTVVYPRIYRAQYRAYLPPGWPYSDISSSSRPAKRQQTIPRRATDMARL